MMEEKRLLNLSVERNGELAYTVTGAGPGAGLTLLHEMIRIRRFAEKSVDVVHGVMKQIGF